MASKVIPFMVSVGHLTQETVKLMGAKISNNYAKTKEVVNADRRGWLICLCVLIITVVRSGITYSFGVFVVKLETVYHSTLAEENWIGTLSFCISLCSAPISVAFIRALKHRGYRIGGLLGVGLLSISCLGSSFVPHPEWLFFTHSFLYGVGSGLLYMASSLVIGDHFDKHHKYHVLATSILLCGYPIGSLLFNPLNAQLVNKYGWRVAFRVSSGMVIISGIVCCWFFTPKTSPRMERLEDEEEEVEQEVNEVEEVDEAKLPRRCCTMAELKEKPEIIMWYLGNMLSYLGFYMPFVNLLMYMEIKGFPPVRSAWSITLLSGAECVTYIMASFMGDYLKGKLIYVNIFSAGFLGCICIIWPLIDVSYSVICMIAMMMGGFLGLTIVYTYAASGEITDLPIDIAWSFTNLFSGLGILFGPLFSGVIYDFRKSYDDVFYVVGVIYFIDTVIFASIPAIQYRRNRNNYTNGITGIPADQHTQTFRITKAVSQSSLVNGEIGNGKVKEYGTTDTTDIMPANDITSAQYQQPVRVDQHMHGQPQPQQRQSHHMQYSYGGYDQ